MSLLTTLLVLSLISVHKTRRHSNNAHAIITKKLTFVGAVVAVIDSFEERQDDRSDLRLIANEGSVEDFVAVHPSVQKHRRDRTLPNRPYAVVMRIHRRDDSFEERFAKSFTLFVFVAHRHRFETRVSEWIRGDGDAGVWN